MERYDLAAASQFQVLVSLGLREHHYMLDIGCGSLRGGRLFIVYLQPGHYCGVEPEEWLLREGIEHEIGKELVALKKCRFINDREFTLTAFRQQFDFILAQSIFSHASSGQIQRCLEQVKKVLKPDGVFVATFFEGETDFPGDEWVYPGSVCYRFETISGFAREYGLSCQRLDFDHHDGQTWIAITHPHRTLEISSPGTRGRLMELEKEIELSRRQLELCRSRLVKLENHPYVKVGIKLREIFRILVKRANADEETR